MSKKKKYIVVFHWADGSTEDDDNYGEYYSSEDEAKEAGEEGLKNTRDGAEILNLSNPGDYPYDADELDENWYSVEEADA